MLEVRNGEERDSRSPDVRRGPDVRVPTSPAVQGQPDLRVPRSPEVPQSRRRIYVYSRGVKFQSSEQALKALQKAGGPPQLDPEAVDVRDLWTEASCRFSDHTGLHYDIQWYVKKHALYAPKVLAAKARVRAAFAAGRRYVCLGFSCNQGRHRSVAMVELLATELARSVDQVEVHIMHLNSGAWRSGCRRGVCGKCAGWVADRIVQA